jgi:hypothetical protein
VRRSAGARQPLWVCGSFQIEPVAARSGKPRLSRPAAISTSTLRVLVEGIREVCPEHGVTWVSWFATVLGETPGAIAKRHAFGPLTARAMPRAPRRKTSGLVGQRESGPPRALPPSGPVVKTPIASSCPRRYEWRETRRSTLPPFPDGGGPMHAAFARGRTCKGSGTTACARGVRAARAGTHPPWASSSALPSVGACTRPVRRRALPAAGVPPRAG